MDKVRYAVQKFSTFCVCGLLASRVALQIIDVLDGKIDLSQLKLPS